MKTLFVRLPPLATLIAQDWQLPLPYALISQSWRQRRQRKFKFEALHYAPLQELPASDLTVWLLAGQDVSLFERVLPKLKPAQLVQAIPHALADQLAQPAGFYSALPLAKVSTAQSHFYCLAAVAQVDTWGHWLRQLQTRAGQHQAYPQSLCLPTHSVYFEQLNQHWVNLNVHRGDYEGLGVSVPSDQWETTLGLIMQASRAPLQTIDVLATEPPEDASDPPVVPDLALAALSKWQLLGTETDIPILKQLSFESYRHFAWEHWITGAWDCQFDLLRGQSLRAQAPTSVRWSVWRSLLISGGVLATIWGTGWTLDTWRQQSQLALWQQAQQALLIEHYPAEAAKDQDPSTAFNRFTALAAAQPNAPVATDRFFASWQQLDQALASVNAQGQKIARLEWRDQQFLIHWNQLDRAQLALMLEALKAAKLTVKDVTAPVWAVSLQP